MAAVSHISTIANEVFAATLGEWGFVSADVSAGADDLGELALFVTGHFSADSPKVPGKVLSEALAELRERIRETGEGRFPYFGLEVIRARA